MLRFTKRPVKFAPLAWRLVLWIVGAGQAMLASAAATDWVDMTIDNGRVAVETKVAGIVGRSMFDTGAQISGINSQFLNAHGLEFRQGTKVKVVGVVDAERRQTYLDIPVEIFGTTIEFGDLVDVNIGSPEWQLSIGAGFFEKLVVQFDYPNQRMRLITRDSIDLKKLKNVESRRDPNGGGSPLVKVRLNDQKDVWLIMDTGNSGGILIERAIAEKAKWLDQYPTTSGTAQGVNASGWIDRFVLPKLTFGGFEILDPSVSVPAEDRGVELFKKERTTGSNVKKARGQYRGLLGYDILKHFVVTIDYKRGHVHVAPPSSE